MAAYRQTHSPRVGSHLKPCHIHHMNRVNSHIGFDDSTINIVIVIIFYYYNNYYMCDYVLPTYH